jgi:hypothetical protein
MAQVTPVASPSSVTRIVLPGGDGPARLQVHRELFALGLAVEEVTDPPHAGDDVDALALEVLWLQDWRGPEPPDGVRHEVRHVLQAVEPAQDGRIGRGAQVPQDHLQGHAGERQIVMECMPGHRERVRLDDGERGQRRQGGLELLLGARNGGGDGGCCISHRALLPRLALRAPVPVRGMACCSCASLP